MIAWVKGRIKRKSGRENNYRPACRGIWDEEGKEEFKNKVGRLEGIEKRIQEEIDRTTERIKRIIEDGEKGKGEKVGGKKG